MSLAEARPTAPGILADRNRAALTGDIWTVPLSMPPVPGTATAAGCCGAGAGWGAGCTIFFLGGAFCWIGLGRGLGLLLNDLDRRKLVVRRRSRRCRRRAATRGILRKRRTRNRTRDTRKQRVRRPPTHYHPPRRREATISTAPFPFGDCRWVIFAGSASIFSRLSESFRQLRFAELTHQYGEGSEGQRKT